MAHAENAENAEKKQGGQTVIEIYKDEKTGKWCGIRANARLMKVDPAHLLRVIRGERQSRRLINRLVASGALRRMGAA